MQVNIVMRLTRRFRPPQRAFDLGLAAAHVNGDVNGSAIAYYCFSPPRMTIGGHHNLARTAGVVERIRSLARQDQMGIDLSRINTKAGTTQPIT